VRDYSMDLKEAALFLGGVIIARTENNGTYIGALKSPDEVNILAVLSYPRQGRPYEFNTVHNFDLKDISRYSSNIPIEYFTEQKYKKSLLNALTDRVREIGLKDDPQKEVIYRHLDEMRGIKCPQR
jgi:hypothetical protein